MRRIIILIIVLLLCFILQASEQDNKPNLISPGDSGNLSIVEESTPTFSWTSVPWASEYRVVVFKSESGSLLSYEEIAGAETPVINKEIKGQATSWTPSSIQRMDTGSHYTWYVQALDHNGSGTWSDGGSFKVEIPVVLSGIEEKLREKLKEKGMTNESLDEVFNDLKTEVKEVIIVDKGRSTAGDSRSGVLGSEDKGTDNVVYGVGAGDSLTITGGLALEGVYNSFFGGYAGYQTSTGDFNTFSGYYAGFTNNTGHSNTFTGYYTGYKTTTGDSNTFTGKAAGYSNSTGDYNTFTGISAGNKNSTGGYNTFSGGRSGFSNTTAYYNTFTGESSGYNNTVGLANTFIGYEAGHYNIDGNNNTFLGNLSGINNTTGSGNLFLGNASGYNETGSNKLYIENSNSSSPLIYGEFDNNIVTINGKLGIGTTTPAFPLEIHTTGSNAKIVINRTDGATGHFLVKTGFATFGTASNHPLRMNVNNIPKVFLLPNGNFGLGVTTPLHPLHLASGAYCSSSGVWQNASSREFKENIMSINSEDAFETLKGLEPVTYNYKLEKDELYAGFIAEDVPELVASKGRKSLGTMDIVAVLTKVVKVQQNKITILQNYKNKQEKVNAGLLKRLEKLEKK